MSVVLESRIVRLRRLIEEQYAANPTGCGASFGEILCHELHTRGLTFSRLSEKWGVSLPTLGRLIADHCERLEEDPRVDHRFAVTAPLARTATAKPRVALEPPAKEPPQVKPVLSPVEKVGKVTISCRIDCGRLAIAIALPAGIAKRLNLKPHGKATADLHGGKVRVRASKEGSAVYLVGQEREGSGRVFFHVLASTFGIREKHRAESCIFHYDLADALLIEPPAWLKPTAAPQKAKADPPASCTKLADKNPLLRCIGCGKVAMVECNLCHKLVCNACWDPHVRTHWHTNAKGKATSAARDARQAMRSGA